MQPATVLALCTVAIAAPMPNPQRLVPLIDINANNNKLDFPINVLGLQTHDVSAANGNLSPGQASAPAAAAAPPAAVPAAAAPAAPAPAAQAPATTTTTTTDTPKGNSANGNTLNFPINVLGAQTHDISAFNGNLSPNRGPAAAAAPAPPQAANAQGGAPAAAAAAPQVANAQGAPAAAAAAPQAANVQGVAAVAAVAPQAANNAQGGLNTTSYVIPATAATVAAVAAPQNGLVGALSGMTSALYALAGAITDASRLRIAARITRGVICVLTRWFSSRLASGSDPRAQAAAHSSRSST
ncbi:hypothetical protein ARSEF1564_006644 [Beauveria bassiana]